MLLSFGRPPSPFHPYARRRRAGIALAVLALVLCSVGAAFFRAQVLHSTEYQLRAEDNRLKSVPIPAPRGAILDRNGQLVAETIVSYGLYLEPAPPSALAYRLQRLAPVLALDSAAVAELLQQAREQPKEPLLAANVLSFEQVSWVEEHRSELPGLRLETHPVRRYPQGEAVAHLVGYTGEISKQELADSTWRDYRRGQQIGKAGLERQYEKILGGRPGERYLEVDARGRVVGALGQDEAIPPRPGKTIRLTLDVELQRFAHAIFPRQMRGALVAMVPSTGEILALYSQPTYDPNLLVGRIPPKVWRALNRDAGRPLLNRATHGTYPPGSTWKLATAIIALEKGAITPATKMPFPCTGGMSYMGRYSRCWKKEGHGFLDLAGAIAHSCNVYFYQLGIRLGLNQLAEEGTRLGFGRKTGIDLPSEKRGTFPTGREWYRKQFGWAPTPSEVMSLAIGQGPNAQTPVRMAQFFAALAGDGTAPRPHLLAQPAQGAAPETDLRVSPQTLRAVREGLVRVVARGGTAHLASLRRWELAGKTGTSQNSQDLKRPHAWFTGFAGRPGGPPEIVVAVVVEHGLHGSDAAPLAAKVADFYLNRKYGYRTERLQTLAERLNGRALGEPEPPRRPAPRLRAVLDALAPAPGLAGAGD